MADAGYYPILIIIDGSGHLQQISLQSFNKEIITMGQIAGQNDICIPDEYISRHPHGVFILRQGRVFYADRGSTNGSYVTTFRGQRFLRGTADEVELTNNSVIRIGSSRDSGRKAIIWLTYMSREDVIYRKVINQPETTIGRDSSNDIVLEHPSVSRIHAVIYQQGDVIELKDNASTNGTLINEEEVVRTRTLQEKDLIQISGFQMVFANRCIYYKKTIGGIGISAHQVQKIVGSGNEKKKILRDVDLEIKPNEFVAIIGGSGAGKSTLMNVLNGFDRSYDGVVQINNVNMKEQFQKIKGMIG